MPTNEELSPLINDGVVQQINDGEIPQINEEDIVDPIDVGALKRDYTTAKRKQTREINKIMKHIADRGSRTQFGMLRSFICLDDCDDAIKAYVSVADLSQDKQQRCREVRQVMKVSPFTNETGIGLRDCLSFLVFRLRKC